MVFSEVQSFALREGVPYGIVNFSVLIMPQGTLSYTNKKRLAEASLFFWWAKAF